MFTQSLFTHTLSLVRLEHVGSVFVSHLFSRSCEFNLVESEVFVDLVPLQLIIVFFYISFSVT